MMAKPSYKGFTLAEWLITVALTALLLGISVPAMIQHVARNRLTGAAEALAANIKLARSEAIRRGDPIHMAVHTGTHWCSGISQGSHCDCTVTNPLSPDACTLTNSSANNLTTIAHHSYPGIELAATSFFKDATVFDPVRGTARPGTVRVKGYRDMELRVILSMLGRVRICAAHKLPIAARYPLC